MQLDFRCKSYSNDPEHLGINRQAPNFIFIDLDRLLFKTDRCLKLALNATLKNINLKLGAHPTVLWSGNGYHIYQPIDAFVLEGIETFSKFDHPSTTFLRFAELYLSNNKSDISHNPSLKSCMVRIPGSYNSKCILAKTDLEVKVIQRWDGLRPKINLLLGSYHAYLTSKEMKKMEGEKQLMKMNSASNNDNTSSITTIPWIEKLIQTPIEDFRKNGLSLILAPYLINTRKLSYNQAFGIIKDWLKKCDLLRTLDFSIDYAVKNAIHNSVKNIYKPLRLDTLKLRNKALYDKLTAHITKI